jgi:aryl-alcohol dehydrogenase-like predicted oxidoreductase
MRYRTLSPRHPDIRVSEIGFGCWTMGGPNWSLTSGQPIGWGDVSDDDIIAGVRAGLEDGVNHWDNADIYGNGRAERTLARAFAALGVPRDSQIIATKVGHFRGTAPYGYDPRHIRAQCEQSLRNLRTDYIDIYYLHHATFTGPDADNRPYDYLAEAAGVVHDLAKEGKIRAVGQSGWNEPDFERILSTVRPAVVQNKANLRSDELIRPGSRMQELLARFDCTFVAFGPLDQGILLNKFDPDNPPKFDEGDYRATRKDFNPDTLRAVRHKLGQIRQRFATPDAPDIETFSSVATRWVLAHDRVCSAIPGFRNHAQARCNLRATLDDPMTPDDVAWLRALFAA